MLAAVNRSINAVDNFSKPLGGATAAINNVLSNNTALQSSLTKEVSSFIDADVAAEQVKLSALTVQQQLSVSSLTSISQARQALLSLFR
jgi:flagellin-like hook-associated protein FlgL